MPAVEAVEPPGGGGGGDHTPGSHASGCTTALIPLAVLTASLTAACSGGGLSIERPVVEPEEVTELLELSFPVGQPKEYQLPFSIPGFFRPYESRIEGCPDWVTLYPDQGVLAGRRPPGDLDASFCTYHVTEADPGFRPARTVSYGLHIEVGEDGSATRPSDPSYYLDTARFTTYQPRVLEQIGAHYAYAMGLTGRGVRIGIEDTIVDYTQTAEFGSRVEVRKADGAQLSYSHPLGDEPSSQVDVCQRSRTCTVLRRDSRGDDEAHNRWVQGIVRENGWPTRDDSVFILDEHFIADGSIEQFLRWWEVPTPYGDQGSHGTIVASVAAGKSLGVAPEATIIPIALNFSPDEQLEEGLAGASLRYAITLLSSAERTQFDDELADTYRDNYAKFDIINRSYGIPEFDPDVVSSAIASELQWYRQYLPDTLGAIFQIETPDDRKTILVYAAGNEGQGHPSLGADLPYYIPELRGHSIAVAATDPRTGSIADYSNRCGSLPPDWNAARHGRHYCLVAPGTARGLSPNPNSPGHGTVGEVNGTSFAAPIVSGALALLMEHFRGTRGNTEIVKRMIDTSDRRGRYADLATYGAGHLDLQAALSPVGSLNAGQSAHSLSRTTLQVPAVYGSIAARIERIELAAFDEQDFPFWVPISALVRTQSKGRSPIPEFVGQEPVDTPATGLGGLGLHWAALESAKDLPILGKQEWVFGLGERAASLAHLPHDGEWGYGLSFDDTGYLESETSGAFGTDVRAGMIWTSRVFQRELGEGVTLNAEGTIAFSLPQYENDAMFSASPSIMSAMSMRIGTESTGLTVEQPLRAESGTGTFRIENGRIENGRRLYDVHRIPLRPDARELRLALRHERDALGGRILVEVGHSQNAGHVPGESETGVGLAYRTTW